MTTPTICACTPLEGRSRGTLRSLLRDLAVAVDDEWTPLSMGPVTSGLHVVWRPIMRSLDDALRDGLLCRMELDGLQQVTTFAELDWSRVRTISMTPFLDSTLFILASCRHSPAELVIFDPFIPHVARGCQCKREGGILRCHRRLFAAIDCRECKAGLWLRLDRAVLPAELIEAIWRLFGSLPLMVHPSN